MNIIPYNTKAYENIANWTLGQSKPNSNPISERPKMNANAFSQKDYRKNNAFAVQKNKPNSNPISVKKCQNKLLLWFDVEKDIILAVVKSD